MTWPRGFFGTLCLSLMMSGIAVADASDEAEVTARVDELLAQAWRVDDIEPSRPASDAELLRRVSLDLTGVIPSVAEVRSFLNDPNPAKRARRPICSCRSGP